MKTLNKCSLLFALALFFLPLSVEAKGPKIEKTKTIVEEFDASILSNVHFNHRRGTLKVKYIDGTRGRVEARVVVKGDKEEDIQTLLDAMKIELSQDGNRVEIRTGNNIKSWSTLKVFFAIRHKIELDNGVVINSKVDKISIDATLYLPKVDVISLSSRYDDLLIESCQANRLEADVHSATIKAAKLDMNAKIKIKYGKLELPQVADLTLESHDSEGLIGNIGRCSIADKYSKFTLGNMVSLDAIFHDGDFKMGNVAEHANITDKYSVIDFGNMQNGNWDLHDSKITVGIAGDIHLTSKYTDFNIDCAKTMKVRSHDDNFTLRKINTLHVVESKYSGYDIGHLLNAIVIDASHDDDFDVRTVATSLSRIELNGKYTDFEVPIPMGLNYSIEASMKYGRLDYPKGGLKETRHIEKNSELEISGVSADGSSKLRVVIKGHDCAINLK